MASVDWKKVKTPNEIKAIMFHNSKETRERTKGHSNTDIDKSRTAQNYSLDGLTYAERCSRYDERIAELDRTTNTNKRKDRVTAICLEYPVPKDLLPEQYADWFAAVHQIVVDRFGADNVICSDCHVDEVHDYLDSISGKLERSRVHFHELVIPVDENGKLNAKAIETKANMKRMNEAVEQMSQEQFGVRFMTGERRRGATVEQVKGESAAIVAKQSRDNEKRTKELKEVRQILLTQAQEQNEREAALNAREAALNAREADYTERATKGLQTLTEATAAYNVAARQAAAASAPANAPDSEFMRFCRRKGYDKDFEKEQAEKQAAEQERLRRQAEAAKKQARVSRFANGSAALQGIVDNIEEKQRIKQGQDKQVSL